MDNPDFIDKIDAFLLGHLPEAEAATMRYAIAQDEALAAKVQLRQLEFELSERVIADDIRTRLKDIREKESEKPPRISRYWFIGAFVLFCIVLITWLRMPSTKSSDGENTLPPVLPIKIDTLPQEAPKAVIETSPPADQTNDLQIKDHRYSALAINSYQKFDPMLLRDLRSGNDGYITLDSALDAWESRRLLDALALARKILSTDPQFVNAQRLEGHILFKLGRFAQASKVFAQIAQDNQNPYKEEAEWLGLLSKLALQEKSNAAIQKQLDDLVKDTGHTYSGDAVKLKAALIALGKN